MERGENDSELINPLWRSVDTLTVEQAASLIAGMDPNRIKFYNAGDALYVSESGLTDSCDDAHTAFIALTSAITDRTLKARLRYDTEPRYVAGIDNLNERGYWQGEDVREYKDWDGESYVIDKVPNWSKTTIARHDLTEWLSSKGFRTGYFFPDATGAPDYLDPRNSRYAPRLAAAVRAWQAVTDTAGISPKQALIKWLREHAAQFELSDDDGKLNETGIEEAAKVANWQSVGGAPKTPG